MYSGYTCTKCGAYAVDMYSFNNHLCFSHSGIGSAVRNVEHPKKHDSDKPDLSLLPAPALEQISRAFMDGEKKYGRYSYKTGKGLEWSRLVAAAMRHLTAFNNGEANASDSGLSHIAHAGANIMMLLDYIENEIGIDNRFKSDKIEKTNKGD